MDSGATDGQRSKALSRAAKHVNSAMKERKDAESLLLDTVDRRNLKSYTNEAASYDRKRFSTPNRQFYVALSNRAIAGLIGLHPQMRILDVATGTGRIALHLARQGAHLTGVDLTPTMLEEAKAKVAAEGLQHVQLQVANARALPFEDHTFDAVTAIRFFHLLPGDVQQEIVQEMYRVVKPGGRVVVEFNNKFSGVFFRILVDVYMQRFHGAPRGGRLWPHHVKKRFGRFPIVRKRGLWFFGMGHLNRRLPKLALALDKLARYFPFYYLTEQLLMVIQKPHAYGDRVRAD